MRVVISTCQARKRFGARHLFFARALSAVDKTHSLGSQAGGVPSIFVAVLAAVVQKHKIRLLELVPFGF